MRWLLVLSVFVTLSGCANRGFVPLTPQAAAIGTPHAIYVATHREPDAAGWYGEARASDLSYTKLQVVIPPAHVPGRITYGYTDPDPRTDFTIAAKQDYAAAAPFQADIKATLAALPPDEREVLLYVHGYNNSFFDGVFRAAQMKHDYDLPGVALHYSWPSAANPLGYTYDRDSVLFARDGLEKVLRDLAASGANRIVLVGHSLGTMLVMESLRQIEIRTPGWSKRALAGVVLVSPDLDVDLFKTQADRLAALPEPFAIFVSRRDRALMLSARINGDAERLGSLTDPSRLAEYPVSIIDVSSFADGDGARHFTLGSSPLLIRLLSQSVDLNSAFQRDTAGQTGLLPGTVLTVRNATQLILSPALALQLEQRPG